MVRKLLPRRSITTSRWPFTRTWNHFTKIVLAQVLRTHFGEPAELESYSSPNSRTSRITMGRILNADADLTARSGIQSTRASAHPGVLRAAQTLGHALTTGMSRRLKETWLRALQRWGQRTSQTCSRNQNAPAPSDVRRSLGRGARDMGIN